MQKANYISLAKCALENINKISSLDYFIRMFKGELQDISEQRHSELKEWMYPVSLLATTNQYVGQQNYFFSFKDEDLNGEISLDFIPEDAKDVLEIMADKKEEKEMAKKLVNFRCQLFSNEPAQKKQLELKHSQLLEIIVNMFGNKGNSTEQDLRLSTLLKELHGKEVTCWHYFIEDRMFVVTLYITFKEYVPYSVFSVSEELNYEPKF